MTTAALLLFLAGLSLGTVLGLLLLQPVLRRSWDTTELAISECKKAQQHAHDALALLDAERAARWGAPSRDRPRLQPLKENQSP